jgi:hypothetical protein
MMLSKRSSAGEAAGRADGAAAVVVQAAHRHRQGNGHPRRSAARGRVARRYDVGWLHF